MTWADIARGVLGFIGGVLLYRGCKWLYLRRRRVQ